jgi:hypothetical protein
MVMSYRKTVLLALPFLCAACDTIHAPIYNMTSCPIFVATVSNVPGSHASPFTQARIEPGRFFGILGPGVLFASVGQVRYSQIDVRDSRGHEKVYDAKTLNLLRSPESNDDRWAYSDGGLSFLVQEPSTASLEQITARPCSVNSP